MHCIKLHRIKWLVLGIASSGHAHSHMRTSTHAHAHTRTSSLVSRILSTWRSVKRASHASSVLVLLSGAFLGLLVGVVWLSALSSSISLASTATATTIPAESLLAARGARVFFCGAREIDAEVKARLCRSSGSSSDSTQSEVSCQSICVCLSACLSVRPCVRQSVSQSVRPSVSPSVRPSVRPSVHPSIRLSIGRSVC